MPDIILKKINNEVYVLLQWDYLNILQILLSHGTSEFGYGNRHVSRPMTLPNTAAATVGSDVCGTYLKFCCQFCTNSTDSSVVISAVLGYFCYKLFPC